MARLPSAEALGGLPSAGSGRQISSIDGSAVGQGMQTMARGMQAYAGGLDAQGRGYARAGQEIAQGVNQLAQSFKVDDDLLDAQIRADFISEKIKLDSEIGTMADPSKFGEIAPRLQELTQKHAQRYPDPRRKQKFLIDTQDDSARTLATAGNRKIGIERDIQLGGNIEQLERIKNDALKATDEGSKAKLIDAGKAIYDGMARNGLIDYSKAATAKQRWVKDYAISDFRMKSPEQQIVALRGNDGALMMRESNGRVGIENPKGYVGLYQFGAPRLETLGVYKAGASEDLKGWADSDKTAPGKWSGQFNIPGFPNVRTKAEFLANADAQEAVYRIHHQKMDQEIKANGFDKYIGKTVGGIVMNEGAIKNMIHLGGTVGAKLFLTSDGVINTNDRARGGSGSMAEYARIGSTAAPSKMTAFLDPEERVQLDREALGNVMRKGHAAEQEERQFAAVQRAQRDAVIDDLEIGLKEDRYGAAEAMKARNDGLLTDPDKYNRIERLVKDQGERIERRALSEGIVDRTIQYNPTNPEHVKALEERVDFAAKATGKSKEEVGAEVYNQTGLMPKAVVQSMRGRLTSGKEEDIIAVGQMAASAMYGGSRVFPNGNPRAFDGFDGGKQISDLGVMWAHFRGMMPKDQDPDGTGAARRIMELRDPTFKSGVKMDDKEERDFKKNIKATAIKDFQNAALTGSGVFSDNVLPPGGLRDQMLEEYAGEVLHYYKKHGGDEDLAREFGKRAIKALYGVSNGVLQKFPVEKALPNMQIEGGHKWVYEAAAQKVGGGVKPKDVFLSEIPLVTSDAFRTQDQGVQYEIVYMKDIGGGQRALDRLPGRFLPAQHFAKAYGEFETKRDEPARKALEANRALNATRPNPRAEDVRTRAGVIPADPAVKQATGDEQEIRRTTGRTPYDDLQRTLNPRLPAPAAEPQPTTRGRLSGKPPSNSSRSVLPGGDK